MEQREEAQEEGVDEVEGDEVEVDGGRGQGAARDGQSTRVIGGRRRLEEEPSAAENQDNHEQQLVVSKLIVINLIVDLVICYIISKCVHTTSFLHRL